MDARERFTDAADAYARHRPDYPDALVEACIDYVPLARGAAVVDIGAGTGISARRFARHGLQVTGIEPNDAMRRQALCEGGATYLPGDAAATGLATDFADLIICGQAMHWFDLDAVAVEWRRILKLEGACAAFWNFRRDDGWQAEYEALLLKHSRAYRDVARAKDGAQDHGAWVRTSGACRDVEEREFANAQELDFEGLLGRANSSSYVIHGIDDRPAFERDLARLFAKRAAYGRVTFRYRTWLLLWRFVP